MWARAKIAGCGAVLSPLMVSLAFVSILVACGATASADNGIVQQVLQQYGQVSNAISQPMQFFQQQQQAIETQIQIHRLTQQINDLQTESANLTIEIADLTSEYQGQMPAGSQPAGAQSNPPAQSPELQAAMQAAAAAQAVCDSLKQKLLAAAHDNAQYQQAAAALDSAQSDLAQAKAASASAAPTNDVIALANEVLADKTLIAKLDRDALASADFQAANAKLQQVNQSLAAVRDKLDQAGSAGPAAPGTLSVTQQLQAEIRQLTVQRDQINVQVQTLLRQLSGISPNDAQLVAQEGEGILEELTQLHQQEQHPQANAVKTPAGAPLILFSPQVSPQVQTFLQGNLDEAQRMQDPTYAAEKQREQLEEAQRQQEQLQQQQAQQ